MRRAPRLRPDLDVFPSPLAEQPGLVLRDVYRYADRSLIVPPPLAPLLERLDGHHDLPRLTELLAPVTGRSRARREVEEMVRVLDRAGYLESAELGRRRAARHDDFRRATVRSAAHLDGLPARPDELSRWLSDALDAPGDDPTPRGLIGLAAPHASPSAARAIYGRAYRRLPVGAADRTFVVLGTSHYGDPDRFGLTRKPFATPLGVTRNDPGLVERLAAAAPDAVVEEDYCHAIEHSIEFQVLFLQHLVRPDVRIVPILCGPLSAEGRSPAGPVPAFLAALAELERERAGELFFVLGIDLAHVGPRYGDRRPVPAASRAAEALLAEDRARLDRLAAGELPRWSSRPDAPDPLRWCGYAPLSAFLGAHPGAAARTIAYDQWSIDPRSMVSIAALDLVPIA